MNAGFPAHRRAGVCLHFSSLPGRHGIGEIGRSAFSFIDTMARMGLCVWQFLPTGPTGYGDSPYQPLSTFAGNELLIDVQSLVEDGLLREIESESLLNLPATHVDYAKVIPLKKSLLERVSGRFSRQASSLIRAEFDQYLNSVNDRWLHDYALFRTLKTRHHERPWPSWDPGYSDRDPAALKTVEKDAADEILHHKIVQFLFQRQWRRLLAHAHSKNVLMFGDMPIYIALDSADVWASRELVSVDDKGRPAFVAGVPPDYFSEDGQLWGNPVYDWEAHAKAHYSWWIERMRHAAATLDLVRIDHFRGFESYWSVPADAETARIGEWKPGPGDELFNALEKSLGGLPIVAEDLGLITSEVEALRDRHQIPGMKVLQFELNSDSFDPATIPENCVCYTATHDNDTSLGWFHGHAPDPRSADEVERIQQTTLRITQGHADSISKDMVGLAMNTPARLAIAPLQDFLGLDSEARLNTPGTSDNNWRWRFQSDALTPKLIDWAGQLVNRSNRG